MSEASAASPVWARWARAAPTAAAKRHCCWSGRVGLRSRRARRVCRRRLPLCRVRRASHPRILRGTTGLSIGIIGRTLTAPVPSRPQPPAARPCRTTPSASCRPSRPPPPSPRPSPASLSSVQGTPVYPHPRS